MYAAAYGHIETVELLISKGCNVNVASVVSTHCWCLFEELILPLTFARTVILV
jgi:ankyrin repeat protein